MSESDEINEGELILYQTQEGTVRIEVLYESETFWLNQKNIAELFGVDLRTVSEHLRNIFSEGELSEMATIRKIRRVQTEGKREVSRNIQRIRSADQRRVRLRRSCQAIGRRAICDLSRAAGSQLRE